MTTAAAKQTPTKACVKTASELTSIDIFSISADVYSDANGAQAYPLDNVKAWSVQRARQLRKDDFELYKQFHDFMTNYDAATTSLINCKTDANREQVDGWIRSVVGAKTIACITSRKESRQALPALLIVSAAFATYGERELVRLYKLGEMDGLSSLRFQPAYIASHQKQLQQKQLEASKSKAGQVVTPPPAPMTAKSTKSVKLSKMTIQKQSPVKSSPVDKKANMKNGATEKAASPVKLISLRMAKN